MQSDIIVKKPPTQQSVSFSPVAPPLDSQHLSQTDPTTQPPIDFSPPQPPEPEPVPEPEVPQPQAETQVIEHVMPKPPIGVITTALFVCLFLVFMAVYGSLS